MEEEPKDLITMTLDELFLEQIRLDELMEYYEEMIHKLSRRRLNVIKQIRLINE